MTTYLTDAQWGGFKQTKQQMKKSQGAVIPSTQNDILLLGISVRSSNLAENNDETYSCT